jgi:large subunit ribosomal protein L24
VELLVGPDKGKQGIISQVIQERNWVIVEGLNCELKVHGKSKDFPGMYIKSEQPLLVTNEVALVDPSDL